MDYQETIDTVMQLYGRADSMTKNNMFMFALSMAGERLANVADYCQNIM